MLSEREKQKEILRRQPFIKMLPKLPPGQICRVDHLIPDFDNSIILGQPRSGKTLLAVGLAHDEYEKGYDVKSVTMETIFSETISPLKLIQFDDDLKECVLLIDEIYTILDARKSQGVNSDMSYFFFQAGKADIKIIATAQIIRTVDNRIVDSNMLSEMITARKVENPDGTVNNFSYVVKDPLGEIPFTLSYEYCRDNIYPLYNTKQKIMPLYVSGRDIINFDDVVAIFDEVTSKSMFMGEVKLIHPYAIEADIKNAYDWLKAGKPERARRILGL